MESFLYAIDQINTNKTLLPGVRLGYDARDTCRDAQVAIQQTLDFISDTEYYNYGRDSVVVAVSYTHLRAHETDSLSRMPSSA